MVEPISTSVARPRITRAGDEAGLPVQGSGAGQATASVAVPSGDSVSLSPSATAMPDELKSGPPIDLTLVARIKEAIAEGKYPIDLEKITESLFENYMELVD